MRGAFFRNAKPGVTFGAKKWLEQVIFLGKARFGTLPFRGKMKRGLFWSWDFGGKLPRHGSGCGKTPSGSDMWNWTLKVLSSSYDLCDPVAPPYRGIEAACETVHPFGDPFCVHVCFEYILSKENQKDTTPIWTPSFLNVTLASICLVVVLLVPLKPTSNWVPFVCHALVIGLYWWFEDLNP